MPAEQNKEEQLVKDLGDLVDYHKQLSERIRDDLANGKPYSGQMDERLRRVIDRYRYLQEQTGLPEINTTSDPRESSE